MINELPALLTGVKYGENMYTCMLHPILRTENFNGERQRESMALLLNHMRQHYLPNLTSMCHIFDVEIPSSSIRYSDESLADSSLSSFSHYDTNGHESESSEELSQSISDNSNFLWSILFLEVN